MIIPEPEEIIVGEVVQFNASAGCAGLQKPAPDIVPGSIVPGSRRCSIQKLTHPPVFRALGVPTVCSLHCHIESRVDVGPQNSSNNSRLCLDGACRGDDPVELGGQIPADRRQWNSTAVGTGQRPF